MALTRSRPHDAPAHASRPFFSNATTNESPAFFDGQLAPTVQRAPAQEELREEQLDGVQTKLRVGEAGDQYEQEADRVAEHVVDQRGAPGITERPSLSRTQLPMSPLVMRQGAGTVTAPPSTEQGIHRARGGGEAMATPVRRDMEQATGVDFSGVRIHNDTEADTMNQSLNARAFTTGQDIFFRHGEYQPETREGQRLLAHELTHVAQQGGSKQLIQADFAVAPTTPGTAVRRLSSAEIQAAIAFNQGIYTNAAQVGELRDVLGISPTPAVIDDDFIQAVVRYQAQYGLTQDGKLDLASANALAREITAESDFVRSGSQPTGTTPGTVQHTGDVRPPPPGAAGPAVGSVAVRTGESVTLAPGSTIPNLIALQYTGALTSDTHWLQFVWFEMTAVTPGGLGRLSGSIPTTSGPQAFTTNPAAPIWKVDSGDVSNPFYDAAGLSLRNSSSTALFDAPGGASVSPLAAAVFGSVPASTSATFTAHFETYLIQNNQAVYVVPYSASTTFTPPATAGGALVGGTISYAVGASGQATALPANLRTLLHASFPIYRGIR